MKTTIAFAMFALFAGILIARAFSMCVDSTLLVALG